MSTPTTPAPLTTHPSQSDLGNTRRRSTSPDAPRKRPLPDPNAAQHSLLRRLALPDDMSQPLVKYDRSDFKDLPTAKDENPHQWNIRRGPPPPIPAGEHLIFTDSIFPHADVPEWNYKANVANDQLEQLSSMEGCMLAVVAHGGGLRFILTQENQTDEIEGFLNSFTFGDGGEKTTVKVIVPVPYRTDIKKTFVHPFTYFLILPEGDDRLRRFLLWQEVFSIHPTLSFSVHEMEATLAWTVLVLTGVNGAVVDSQDAKQAVLANIKRKLWANVCYCSLAARLVAKNWGFQTDFASRVKAATDTFELSVARAEQHSTEKLIPCYVLLAKPLSTDRAEHEEVLACITEPKRYWNGPYALDVDKAVVSCKICKDTTHCTADCDLPSTPGWQGPTAETLNLPNAKTGVKAAPTLQQQVQEIWKHTPRHDERKGKGKGKGPAKKASGSGRPGRGSRR
ncbi:hypothetical protein LXA43DRAFT_1028524 [Ganoderma leucocontextum]|nr:hypothetical protein LXA43DRAFT_1028524 [Ganoderma leucocontextum]